jgi:RNA polymerase sigma-70 factor (ECF subfamily)
MELVSGSARGGIREMLNELDQDFTDGVGGRFANAVTSHDTTVWELDLISPPHDPDHCPPRVVWLMTHADGWVTRLRLFHPV